MISGFGFSPVNIRINYQSDAFCLGPASSFPAQTTRSSRSCFRCSRLVSSIMGDAKRRLPSWMSCTTTPNPTPENHMVDNVAEKERTKKLIKKSQLVSDEENHKVDNGAEKKVTRKLIKKPQVVAEDENHKVDNAAEKKGRRKLIKEHKFVGGEDDSCLPHKKRRTNKQVEAQTNPTVHPPNKDNTEEDDYNDEELTVDDLISIAQEYVNADARKERELGATIEPETGKQITTASVMSRKDLESSTFSSDILPAHTSSALSSNSYDAKSTVQEHSAEQVTTHNFISTGDPAQDMLDLFLGPLLKKSNVELPNREIYKRDIALDHNLQKQSQKEESEKQLPTLMKKKSSLRDKVAMLLD